MVSIHPQRIEGHWQSGIALDFQTTSSTPIGPNEAGHMQFDTVRPDIAELLYQLKYRHDQAAAPAIISAAASFLRPHRAKFDLLVPVPPSNARPLQPVLILALGIGASIDLPVVDCITTTRATLPLKGVIDPDERQKLVAGLYAVDHALTEARNVLLFDDLFRSGSTMNAVTDVLFQQGRVKSVRALAITRTRSNR